MIATDNIINSKCTQKDKWATPQDLFDELNKEFGFTLDPCCEPHTSKCETYYTEDDNGLLKDWKGHRVYVNPPYSRGRIGAWAKKCLDEKNKGVLVVALFPVSTSSKWFHDYVLNEAELRFIKGRVRFVGAKNSAPFSSVIAVYNPKSNNK